MLLQATSVYYLPVTEQLITSTFSPVAVQNKLDVTAFIQPHSTFRTGFLEIIGRGYNLYCFIYRLKLIKSNSTQKLYRVELILGSELLRYKIRLYYDCYLNPFFIQIMHHNTYGGIK